jgi:transposase
MNALAATHDAAVQMIDTSIIRVHQHAACIARNKRQSMGRSRSGLTSKIHAVVDTDGLPIRLALTTGEAHDNRLASKLLSRLKSGTMLLADRGYDADWIRALATERGVWANIPPRCNRNDPVCFSPYLYRARNLVERFFNKIKQCRRVTTRYDKPSCNGTQCRPIASIIPSLHQEGRPMRALPFAVLLVFLTNASAETQVSDRQVFDSANTLLRGCKRFELVINLKIARALARARFRRCLQGPARRILPLTDGPRSGGALLAQREYAR